MINIFSLNFCICIIKQMSPYADSFYKKFSNFLWYYSRSVWPKRIAYFILVFKLICSHMCEIVRWISRQRSSSFSALHFRWRHNFYWMTQWEICSFCSEWQRLSSASECARQSKYATLWLACAHGRCSLASALRPTPQSRDILFPGPRLARCAQFYEKQINSKRQKKNKEVTQQ